MPSRVSRSSPLLPCRKVVIVADMKSAKVTYVTLSAVTAASVVLTACSTDGATDEAPLSTQAPTTTTESPTSTTTSSSADTEDLNSYDGFYTNDFYTALHKLPGLEQRSGESNPKDYSTEAELLNSDETLRVLSFIYIPKVDGEYQPITPTSDKGLQQAYDSAVDVFNDENYDFKETEHDTANFTWQCVEAQDAQEGNIDYDICVTAFAGRVIEAQRQILTEDRDDSDKKLDKLLNDFDDVLSDMKRR